MALVMRKKVFIGPYAMILGDVEIDGGTAIGINTLVLENIPTDIVYINGESLNNLYNRFY